MAKDETKHETKTEESADQRLAKPGVVVELIVGDQWVDELSGISLYRGFYRLASKDELRKDRQAKEFGYIREEERQPIAELPKGKDLSRVEKAIRLGILKIYDPKNPTEYKERTPPTHRRINDSEVDSGSRYSSVEEEKIAALLKMNYPLFVSKLKDFKSIAMLDRIFEAECEGRNPTAGPRKMYTDAIKYRMQASDVGGVSRVTSKESERIEIR